MSKEYSEPCNSGHPTAVDDVDPDLIDVADSEDDMDSDLNKVAKSEDDVNSDVDEDRMEDDVPEEEDVSEEEEDVQEEEDVPEKGKDEKKECIVINGMTYDEIKALSPEFASFYKPFRDYTKEGSWLQIPDETEEEKVVRQNRERESGWVVAEAPEFVFSFPYKPTPFMKPIVDDYIKKVKESKGFGINIRCPYSCHGLVRITPQYDYTRKLRFEYIDIIVHIAKAAVYQHNKRTGDALKLYDVLEANMMELSRCSQYYFITLVALLGESKKDYQARIKFDKYRSPYMYDAFVDTQSFVPKISDDK